MALQLLRGVGSPPGELSDILLSASLCLLLGEPVSDRVDLFPMALTGLVSLSELASANYINSLIEITR